MSFQGTTVADIWGDLKEYYSLKTTLRSLIFQNHPLLSIIARDPDFQGKLYPGPVTIAPSAGGSADFGYAYANQSASDVKEFQVPAMELFRLATITTKAQLASRGSPGAFMSAVKLEIDNAMKGIANDLAYQICAGGNGVIGTISAITSFTVTLVNTSDAINFFRNMVITAFTTAGVQRGFIGRIVSVDRSLGKVTFIQLPGSTVSSIDWAATDQLTPQGNWKAVLTGIDGWYPQGANRPVQGGTPTQNMLFSVDRSEDPQMLAGVYVDGSSETVEEAIIDLLKEVWRYGGPAKHVMVSPDSMAYLDKTMQARKRYVNMDTDVGVSVSGIEFNGPNGECVVFADPYCKPRSAYALPLDDMKLISYGTMPEMEQFYGGGQLALPNAAASQIRVYAFGNVLIQAPGFGGVASLAV